MHVLIVDKREAYVRFPFTYSASIFIAMLFKVP